MVKDQRGLTLIELLAVIVILAIILAIAVPAIGNLINRTDDRATVSDAAQVIAAAKLHVATNGTPPASAAGTPNLNGEALKPYLDNADWATGTTDTTRGVRVTVNGNVVSYEVVGHKVTAILDKWTTTATKKVPSEENIQEYLNDRN
ncbi:prepilin-type N-terminal cleavage/methylation domain-containing protein [Alkalihalobacillus sp. LMS39]|uniref:prepilin-type N-terminal cleavage/methylation domain-containing protein n=1 Tax=Alkalihalobacillus sp. LMS39 TaxID=2924032 RepID=UPI001FB42659|nr:prepilin-type N-terminal cleavage/methylation domain-containing protein [Alkalihalobacillus sp. LMS39]UOE93311.1 prepilin-type N-terminal cleavage/methylation domain-containing protein [Alkalihalobacillus sp. LMS39]